jgi:hypothetical protein
LARFEFEFRIVLFCLSFIFVSLENHVCLSRGVQVAGVAWHAATRTMAGVGDLVQRIVDDRTGRVLGGRAVGWHYVRSTPGTWRQGAQVSWLSLKTKVDGL